MRFATGRQAGDSTMLRGGAARVALGVQVLESSTE